MTRSHEEFRTRVVAHALALARRAGVQTFGAFELAAALAAAPLGVS
jgi:hypothetical protein